jgi:tyrosine-protein kinase Etk/Wzc
MNQQHARNSEPNPDNEVDVKKWLNRLLKSWPWFIASIFLFLVLAFIYMMFAHSSYDATAAILVKDDKKGSQMMDNSVLKEMGLGGDNKLVENEVEVLKSPDLLEAISKKLKLYMDVSRVGRIKNIPVFDNELPFIIEILNPDDIQFHIYWQFKQAKNGYLFKNEADISYLYFQAQQFGKVYKSGNISYRLTANPKFTGDEELKDNEDTSLHTYDAKLTPTDEVILGYAKRLKIEQATKLATVIDLSITDINEKRALAILQTLIDEYNESGLEDKNRATDNTINFLNERLIAVNNELKEVEGTVQKFKSKNKITDITADQEQYMLLAQQVDVQKAQSETQLNIINALEQNLEKNQNNPQLVPSTLGIAEPTLGLLIEQHNQLVLQKERVLQRSGPKNPLLIDLQAQIDEIRVRLLDNVKNLKQAYSIALNDVSKKDNTLNGLMSNVPVLERNLIEITRDKDVQQQIYAFLLQKREESAITRSSNVEDSRTISSPRSYGKKWPKKNVILGLAFMLGLIFPVGVIYIRDFLNNSVGDMTQIGQATDLPILGSISHVKTYKSSVVVNSKSRSVVSEQIRHIRTSIGFTGKGKIVKSILATSFQPGDGKSFVSLNLAASYALLNKKTCILEFDLRKPHVAKYLNLEVKEGISSYLSGKSCLRDLLIEVPGFEGNLYLLPAGYLPPNPAELIEGPYMEKMMKELEEQFDYLILDTPPFSLVTDASLLQQYTNISLVILRQGHTSRDVYKELNRFANNHSGNPLYLLLNDVGKSKRYQNSYGYGNGYYTEEE